MTRPLRIHRPIECHGHAQHLDKQREDLTVTNFPCPSNHHPISRARQEESSLPVDYLDRQASLDGLRMEPIPTSSSSPLPPLASSEEDRSPLALLRWVQQC